MALISAGISLCVRGEANYNLFGITCCFAGCLLRAAKSLVSEKLLKTGKGEGGLDSVALLLYMAPWSGLILVPMMLYTEGMAPVYLLHPRWAGQMLATQGPGHASQPQVALLAS